MSKLETYKKIIESYIFVCLNSKTNINNYVPNTHIANTFDEILLFLDIEDKYKIDFINYPILNLLNDYFNIDTLNNNKEDEVHRTYQKLREKNDIIRNRLKLVKIELRDIVMPEISSKTIKYKI